MQATALIAGVIADVFKMPDDFPEGEYFKVTVNATLNKSDADQSLPFEVRKRVEATSTSSPISRSSPTPISPSPGLGSGSPARTTPTCTLPLAGSEPTMDVDVSTATSLEHYDDDTDLLLNFCMPATATLLELRSCMQVEDPGLDFSFLKARKLSVDKTVWVKIGQSNEARQLLSSFGSPGSSTVFISIKRV